MPPICVMTLWWSMMVLSTRRARARVGRPRMGFLAGHASRPGLGGCLGPRDAGTCQHEGFSNHAACRVAFSRPPSVFFFLGATASRTGFSATRSGPPGRVAGLPTRNRSGGRRPSAARPSCPTSGLTPNLRAPTRISLARDFRPLNARH